MTTSIRACFEEALDDADGLVRRAAEASLGLATPCEGWDLGALLGHMIGQNRGFAIAVRAGDAPLAAYAAPVLTPGEVLPRWSDSASRLREAFRTAPADRTVRLAEFAGREVPVEVALGMQVVDCAVHAWDAATALGQAYRPSAAVVEVVLASARMIAARPGGTPGVFAPPREVAGDDPWAEALALLGR